MRPIVVTVGNMTTAAGATVIRTATTVAAGNLVLNGAQVTNGVGILEVDRDLLFTFAGAEVGLQLLIEGSNTIGTPLSEIITGPAGAGTIVTVNQYRKIYRISANKASAAAVSIGTSSSLSTSQWVRFDDWVAGGVAIQATVSGTVNFTLQQSLDDPNSPTSPVTPAGVTWVSSADTAMVGATANQQSNYAYAPALARILLNSGTGLVTATFTQLGTPAR